jgi:hypothetical protein
VAERHEELFLAGLVEQLLDAVGQRRADPFAFGGPVPVVGGGDRAGVGGEAEQPAVVVAVPFADELADVELARTGPFGGTRVAEMRVVGPDDDLRRLAPLAAEVIDERVRGRLLRSARTGRRRPGRTVPRRWVSPPPPASPPRE